MRERGGGRKRGRERSEGRRKRGKEKEEERKRRGREKERGGRGKERFGTVKEFERGKYSFFVSPSSLGVSGARSIWM